MRDVHDQKEDIIVPPNQLSLNIGELWRYRELFYFFTWRDVKVKYKHTVLGILWAILQPLFLMLLFTFFFGRSLKIDNLDMPYPVFIFSGLTLWTIFSTGIASASNSMVSNSNIIKKVYFPRLIIPISSILSALVDFAFTMIVFAGMLIWYKQPVNFLMAIFFWPASLVLSCLGTFGAGAWLAALNIKYRDFRYIIPFILQALLFLTPIIYPASIVSSSMMQYLLALNPMYAAIEIFRAPLSHEIQNVALVYTSMASAVLIFIIGLLYFKKTEIYFADLA